MSVPCMSGVCPGGSEVKASACNACDLGSIPVSRRLLEKKMATHSSTPAWRIPWTEEPGGLQSTGLQRVGHDWATSLSFLYVKCILIAVYHQLICTKPTMNFPRSTQSHLKWQLALPPGQSCSSHSFLHSQDYKA